MQTDIEQRQKPYKFNVRDKVWLQAKQIKIHQQLAKLGPKQLGPFEVTEVRSDINYKLALPPALKVHNVFHIDCLSVKAQRSLSMLNMSSPSDSVCASCYSTTCKTLKWSPTLR